jgi:cobalt/nickel transport system permease protein
LEWSIEQVSNGEELLSPDTPYHAAAERVVQQTALMPDYNTSLAGILGSGAIILAVFALSFLFRRRNHI